MFFFNVFIFRRKIFFIKIIIFIKNIFVNVLCVKKKFFLFFLSSFYKKCYYFKNIVNILKSKKYNNILFFYFFLFIDVLKVIIYIFSNTCKKYLVFLKKRLYLKNFYYTFISLIPISFLSIFTIGLYHITNDIEIDYYCLFSNTYFVIDYEYLNDQVNSYIECLEILRIRKNDPVFADEHLQFKMFYRKHLKYVTFKKKTIYSSS